MTLEKEVKGAGVRELGVDRRRWKQMDGWKDRDAGKVEKVS